MIARPRALALIALASIVLATGAALVVRRMSGGASDGPGPSAEARLPSLDEASGWLNGGPLTPDSLRGRVAVVVLWSDTDPRSLSVLPEVEGWHEAFARYGVRVVGVHAPDYSFGADPGVPARAARRLGLRFPIALDPRYRIHLDGTERPIIAIADTAGRIVFRADGEHVAEADRAIRDQMRGLHPAIGFPADPHADPGGARGTRVETRFAFLGTARVTGGPLSGVQPGRTLNFTTQFRYQEEGESFVPYPVGRWTPSAEGLTAAHGGAMNFVAIRCGPGRTSVVLGPPANGAARVWILEDDAWLATEALDDDVRRDARGATYVEVTEPRLYRIHHGTRGRVLKLSPEDPGVTVYAFAFESKGANGSRMVGAVEGGR